MSRFILDIPGWEWQSIWGIDWATGFFAQLYRNDAPATQDAPDIWINDTELRSFITRTAHATGIQQERLVPLLADSVGTDTEARKWIGALIASSTDTRLLAACAASHLDWVRLEANGNPYWSEPTPQRKATLTNRTGASMRTNAGDHEETVLPTVRKNKEADVKPTSFRLDTELLDALTAWVYSDANTCHLNRTQVVSTAIAQYIGYRPENE